MWVLQEWEDYSLRWDPAEYGGVQMLYVPSESIWLPDIVLYNNADGDYTVTIMTKATISWYGGVKWYPPAIFKSQCDIDVEYFPFDQQNCRLKFGSWSYHGFDVDVKHFWHDRLATDNETAIVDPGIDLKSYYRSVEWDLISASARKNIKKYPCCAEPYPDVSFYITLRRKTLFYTINLIIPCVSITLLTILGFYLPSDCGEKISLCISLLLSLSLFQLLLLEIIPPTSLKMPLIGKYILLTTILVTLSVLTSVLILNVNFRTDITHDMPKVVRKLFLEILPKFLWMKRPQQDEEEETDFNWAHSDLSNYENPYKKKFRPLFREQSTENLHMKVNYNTTFVGVEENNVDLSAFCQACSDQRMLKHPQNVRKAFDGVMFIARHTKETMTDSDEKNEILALNMWVLQEWKDYNLQWDPAEYGGVQMLYVPSESIWLPDIVLYNNADGDYTVTIMTKATISWYGGVKWYPPAIFKSQCDIDVEYFPFDQQDCTLKLGSWSYDGTQVDVKHFWHHKLGTNNETAVIDPGVDLKSYYISVEWDLLAASAKKNIKFYPCCPEPYPDVSFYITLRRKTLFYTINLIIPCVSITLLTILGFYLPSDCGEKISLCISLLLSLSLFQLLLLEIIPPTSLKMPLIGKYILFTTVLVTLSVLTSVLILNVNFRSDTTHDMPKWVRRLFLEILPKYLWMKRPEQDEEEETDFNWAHSDLSNYENPYKKKFRPLFREQSTDNLVKVHYNTTFVGMEDNNVDMSAFCQACSQERMMKHPLNVRKAFDGVMFLARHTKENSDDNACYQMRMRKYPNNVVKAFDGVPYIAKHLKDGDDSSKVKEDWRYVALVFDRILLWIYILVCGVSTMGLLMNAPALYDGTDEKNEILALNMWVLQEWEDYSLRWDPEEYGGVQMLYVPSESIWLPDIVLYNNADGDYTVTIMTKATVSWYGGVKWYPPAIFKSQCDIDVEYFPFDQQHCRLKFGSWTYDGFEVDVKHFWHDRLGTENETAIVDPGIDLKSYYISVEWDLISASARKNIKYYPCCKEPFPDVSFYITLRRKTLFYTINLIIPCVSISLLTILGFYLPSDCGEKISLCISLLLSLSLFQLLLLEIIPPTSLKMPLIGKYILLTTVLVTLSVLTSVLILNVNYRSDITHDMPKFVRKLFLEILPKFLWMKRPEQAVEEETDFDWAHSDLSNYENPYKKKFRPLFREQTTDNLFMKVNYKTSFVGMDSVEENNVDMSAFCQACSEERMMKYPLNVRKAFDGVMFIAHHTKEAAPDSACYQMRMSKYPANVVKAFDGVPYIAKHLKDGDDSSKVKEDWRFVALVIDRILLWIYILVCGISTMGLLMNAPALYDGTPPMRTTED